ncbi:unnamed protein product [Sphagnum jensenii]|uniref:Aconitate hydratase n=1 Tax=Sphagnum jensenii TaxID=128206 RepID=A0ABP1A2I0_9BRYO
MSFFGKDSLNVKMSFNVNGKSYRYFSINEAAKQLGKDISRLPFSLKILFENLLRFENDQTVKVSDIKAFADWIDNKKSDHEIAFTPARVLMQDFTGVPAVVDLAAMRDAVSKLGGDPQKINPLSPVDLVIDHSVQVDKAGTSSAFRENVDLEMQRNAERYEFLRWGQEAFTNFRVVPPGTGICHQVNLEYLSQVVWTRQDDGHSYAFPDTLVGTDSHTTMVNGLGVLGWGVGGIEAEAAMLGQAMSMLIPEVIGFKLTGSLKEGTTATDLVLTVTQMLRKKGVVNKFVEFYGNGLASLALADRATIANMAPEYGATCGFFAVDEETIKYLKLTARDEDRIALVKEYCKAQGLWRDANTPDPVFTDTLELDLATVEPSLAGPKRPQDKVLLSKATTEFVNILPTIATGNKTTEKFAEVNGQNYKLANGDVVIAAITSCTNTSNPYVMVAAGLVAKKAAERGLTAQPWVKASLAPGSQVVSEYLNNSGLQPYLDKNPPYFEGMKKEIGKIEDVKGATLLAKLGDSITTDHISPAGSISKTSPAAKYLTDNGVEKADFNSYGSRRGNHEIMMRGTFANIRIKNEIAPGTEGGFTTYIPTGEVLSIYDAAMKYKQNNTPLVIVAGKEYGTGSSRDWAAKGTLLLGVKAVIAESFERIHRSNLVRMGVLPFVFKDGMTRNDLNLKGDEKFDIVGLSNDMAPLMDVKCTITRKDGTTQQIILMSRVDTIDEVIYLKNGGILQYVIRQII